jgi:pyruvate dehydrogenase E2 component (dihydrolipoamide acetyltransferase)
LADVTMPQLGETVTEGTITRWHKQIGELVAQDEVLFEVSTDKVDSEVPSPFSGKLAQILVQEGETVDVGTRLAVIAGEGERAQAPPAQETPPSPAASEPPPAQDRDAAGGQEAPPVPAARTLPPAAPPAGARAEAPPSPAASEPPPSQREPTGNGRRGPLVLSPVVRRLLSEHGLDPAEIPGTGRGGRITRDDVLAFIDARSAAPAPAAAAPSPGPLAQPAPGPAPATPAPQPAVTRPAAPAEPVVAGERDEVIPFSNIRRRTAEHMVRSKATSAHTLVACEADFEAVERVRAAHRERFRAEEGFPLTYLPFVALATVEALRAFPRLNASVGDDALIVHRDLNLAIAVDLDHEGLVAPVIHEADGKRLRALARAIADLAGRARSRRLTPDDIAGGTFTITNAGTFGTFLTVPIINQPQVGILATDGVRRRPVVVELPRGGEAIAIHSVGMLALSFDHRAVDGAYGSAFLAKLREVIEGRDWANEL